MHPCRKKKALPPRYINRVKNSIAYLRDKYCTKKKCRHLCVATIIKNNENYHSIKISFVIIIR